MEIAQALQAAAGSFYMLTLAIVGIRLLLLWRRTRHKPELLLAGSLIVGGVFGAVLEASGLASRTLADPALVGKLLLSGKCFGVLGLALQGLFIRLVFRPSAKWATALVSVCVATAALAIIGFHYSGTFVTGDLPTAWVMVELAARLTIPIWLVSESGRYAISMRKRLAIGLGDPMVANRFLLWAIAGSLGLVILISSLPPIFLDVQVWEGLLFANLLAFSAAGVGSACFYWLTFFPPAAYKRWIIGQTPSPS
jgi:hypothetical protein